MPSFPLVSELPSVLSTRGWSWKCFDPERTSNFWIGTDLEGNRWLTKLRGVEYAYREIVFDRLAQRMGWSCQSTIFLRLSAKDMKLLGVTERVHGAHWFLDEHSLRQGCSPGCPAILLPGQSFDSVDDRVSSGINHLLDWPKSRLAACLFGGNEPPDHLITTDHEFVIIDSEQMFATKPCPLSGCSMRCFAGEHQNSYQELALEVCHDLVRLTEEVLNNALAIPQGIRGLSQRKRDTATRLKASYHFACDYISGRPYC